MSASLEIEYTLDIVGRHILVEQVAHGINEYPFRRLPFERNIQHLRLLGHSKPVPIIRLPHQLKAMC